MYDLSRIPPLSAYLLNITVTWKWSNLCAKSKIDLGDFPAGYVGVVQFGMHIHPSLL